MGVQITAEEKAALDKVFAHFGKEKYDVDIFYCMVFCLCAPQTTFKGNMKVNAILREMDYYNVDISQKVLEELLKPVRYNVTKAKFLKAARERFKSVLEVVRDKEFFTPYEKREKLMKLIKGFGYKTTSHFMRNCGDQELAIIDVHVLKFLKTYGVEDKDYKKLEAEFQRIAREEGVTTAQLDAIVWQRYSGTPWDQFVY